MTGPSRTFSVTTSVGCRSDGFPYALAKTEGEPLLFKGLDFPMTDVGVVAK